MTADRIEKLRAALEQIKAMADDGDDLDAIHDVADRALDEDERARLCAPSEEL